MKFPPYRAASIPAKKSPALPCRTSLPKFTSRLTHSVIYCDPFIYYTNPRHSCKEFFDYFKKIHKITGQIQFLGTAAGPGAEELQTIRKSSPKRVGRPFVSLYNRREQREKIRKGVPLAG
jgi:hypothetical protein